MSTQPEQTIKQTDGWTQVAPAGSQGALVQNVDSNKISRYAESADKPTVTGMVLRHTDGIYVVSGDPTWIKPENGYDKVTVSVTLP